MTNGSGWSPDKEEALKALIRQTIDAAGAGDPSSLPHRVKERLKGRATGELDVEAYVKEVLRERSKRP
ncbi:MAG TPA: hypothetical protein PK585_02200 [Amphiplicatus sp.]|nr:hypothetical protein [Amphiplicatus sp.]